MLPEHLNQLNAMATARLVSALIPVMFTQSAPSDEATVASQYKALVADLTATLGSLVKTPIPDGPDSDVAVMDRFCDLATGDETAHLQGQPAAYDMQAVGAMLGRMLPKIRPAYADAGIQAEQGMYDWLTMHGQKSSGFSWLLNQAVQLIAADAVKPKPKE